MNDEEILHTIQTLVDEEHTLLRLREEGKLQEDEHERISKLEVSLDQCWDLLRQRRGRRHAGLNPDEAAVRDAETVEHYKQ